VNMGMFAVAGMLILLRLVRSHSRDRRKRRNRPRGSSTRWSLGTPSGIFREIPRVPWKWTESGNGTVSSRTRTISIPASRSLSSRRSEGDRARQEPASASVPLKRLRGRSAVEAAPPAVPSSPPPRAVPRHQAGGFRRAGEFSKEAPKGIGNIQAGRDRRSDSSQATRSTSPSGRRSGRPAARRLPGPGRSIVRGNVRFPDM